MTTNPDPVIGEVRELSEITWDPWVIVLALFDNDGPDEPYAEFAVLDHLDDGVFQTVSDEMVALIEDSVGDRDERERIAAAIRADDNIDTFTAPVHRLRPLGRAGVQGTGEDIRTDGGTKYGHLLEDDHDDGREPMTTTHWGADTQHVFSTWTTKPFVGHRHRHETVEHRAVVQYHDGVGADFLHQVRSSDSAKFADEWQTVESVELRDHGARFDRWPEARYLSD